MSEELRKALQQLGEAARETCEALGVFAQKVGHLLSTACNPVFISWMQRLAEAQSALQEAPPRVRHLATHSKKHRTRKKNLNRTLRLYLKSKEEGTHGEH